MDTTRIDKACEFAVAVAASPAHGYTQGAGRCGPTDYDCTGLTARALEKGGYPIYVGYDSANLGAELERIGFRRRLYVPGTLKKGSVELKPKTATTTGHAAICTDAARQLITEAVANEFGGIIGGQPGDQTGGEIRTGKDWQFGKYIYDPPEYFEPEPEPKPDPREPGGELMSKPQYGAAFERFYNQYSGGHTYSCDLAERAALKKAGWTPEKIMGLIPSEGRILYRLYNENLADHIYTINYGEALNLVKAGWVSEGEPAVAHLPGGGDIDVTRLYHRSSGLHLLTVDSNEVKSLTSNGWVDEGVAFALDRA